MSVLGIPKTSLQLYRDCLRLVRHIAPGTSGKSVALRNTVKKEFAKNRNVQDEQQIQALQANAVRALSNYLLFQNARMDPKVKQAVKAFHEKHVSEASTEQKTQSSSSQRSVLPANSSSESTT